MILFPRFIVMQRTVTSSPPSTPLLLVVQHVRIAPERQNAEEATKEPHREFSGANTNSGYLRHPTNQPWPQKPRPMAQGRCFGATEWKLNIFQSRPLVSFLCFLAGRVTKSLAAVLLLVLVGRLFGSPLSDNGRPYYNCCCGPRTGQSRGQSLEGR